MKNVRFDKVHVHLLFTWSYAYREARRGPWERAAVDRVRFKRRIEEAAIYINPILDMNHRNKIKRNRMFDC